MRARLDEARAALRCPQVRTPIQVWNVKSAISLIAICLIVISSTSGTSQFEKKLWKQKILLLQSTRADVERTLGKPRSGEDYLVSYKLKDGMLNLEYYSFEHCKPSNGLTAFFNVPEWTVIEIDFRPDSQPAVKTLHLNLSQLRKAHLNPDLPDALSYIDDKNGIEYEIDESNHTFNNVRYFPGSRYDALRCPEK